MEELDIFSLSVEDIKTEEVAKPKNDTFKPNPKEGKDGVYSAIIRFIPNIKNPKKSIIKKYNYWLENNAGEGFFVDCPTTINEKSIINETFWKLYKSDSAFDKKQAERIKRKENNYSYVYIVKDIQNPKLDGTVQLFKFPNAIKKLIDAQLSPDEAEIEMGTEPINVFDFFKGKDFKLKVTLKAGFWNYDECKFNESISPIKINNVKMENNAASKEIILGLYKDVTPLENNEYKPWTSEQEERIKKFLAEVTGNPSEAISKVTAPAPKVEAKPKATQSEAPVKEVKVEETVTAAGGDEDIDEWLKQFEVGSEE